MNKQLIITVDKRLEVLYILGTLADYDLINISNLYYKREVLKYFGEFKEHNAVNLLKFLIKNDFHFDALPKLFLYFDENFQYNFDWDFDLKGRFDYRIKNTNFSLKNFILEILDFISKSNFNNFFNSMKPYYSELKKQFNFLQNIIKIKEIEKYFGIQQLSYNLILCPLLGSHGFAGRFSTNKGKKIYSINAPYFNNTNPQTLKDFNHKGFIVHLLHEFAHSFVNDLTDKYWEKIKLYPKFLNKIDGSCKEKQYRNRSIINEYIVRVISFRLRVPIYNQPQEFRKFCINENLKRGFIYIEEFYDLFDEYEKNRNEYKSLESFYPMILKQIEIIEKNLS